MAEPAMLYPYYFPTTAVFVDDNPYEIAAVEEAHPDVFRPRAGNGR